MHLPLDYIHSADLGDFCHPPLDANPKRPKHTEFSEEINSKGVYIHKLHLDNSTIKKQLDKMVENKLPTPGTMVGVGLHRTYTLKRWEGASGFVFSPSTASLLSYKGDIYSDRLRHDRDGRTFADFNNGTHDEQLVDYASNLRNRFNQLGETSSAYRYRIPKQLRLVADVSFANAKYRELEIRSNLAFRKKSDAMPGDIKDESSKHLIVRLLKAAGKPVNAMTKADLLQWLGDQSTPDHPVTLVLEHAIRKIERFKDDAAVEKYLGRVENPTPPKSNGTHTKYPEGHYTKTVREWSAQTPNEHLLLPKIEDVAGISVNVESVAGIDQAMVINRELRERQNQQGMSARDNPAIVHQISRKVNRSLIHIGWTQAVIPWSTDGLKDFAKTGQTDTIKSGRDRGVNHFTLIRMLADAGALRFFEEERTFNGVKVEKNFVDDLSMIKEGQDNLLHLAIENGRDLDFIKFLYFWKVDAFSENNAQGKTALELAQVKNGPAYEFLKEAETYVGNAVKIATNRNNYISKRIAALPQRDAIYRMRSGIVEEGKTSYIPELGAMRVTAGKSWIDNDAGCIYEGVRKYSQDLGDDKQLGDMALTVGTCTNKHQTEKPNMQAGLWEMRDSTNSYQQRLRLGAQHWQEKKSSAKGLAVPECIGFISKIDGNHAAIRFYLGKKNRRYTEVVVECSLSSPRSNRRLKVTDGCSHVKTKVFIPNNALENFRSDKLFSHLQVDEKSMDRDLSEREKKLVRSKFLLAQIHYLSAWQNSLPRLANDEIGCIEEANPDFISQTHSNLAQQKKELHTLLENHVLTIADELKNADNYGKSLLQEIGKLYLESDNPDHVHIQTVLAQQFESTGSSIPENVIVARELYERAAKCQYGIAEAALARFYEQGLAGLQKDQNKAKEYAALASAHGAPNAIPMPAVAPHIVAAPAPIIPSTVLSPKVRIPIFGSIAKKMSKLFVRS